MLQAINNRIRRKFGGSAKNYDLHSGLHRGIAEQLLAQIANVPKPLAILDVGCGTGYLTIRARELFPQSQIIGVDFAPEMLKIASAKHEGVSWVLADGHDLPFIDGRFDIVISNLAYQWSENLPRIFAQARRVLRPQGILVCTIFGHNTCKELFQCLDEAKRGALRFDRLPDEGQVREALLNGGFRSTKIDCEQIKVEFKDMQELLAWLRSIGANNLAREGYVGKEAITKAAAIYRERFSGDNGIGATFEVIRVYVKK